MFNLSPPSTDGGQRLAVNEEAWHAFPLLAFPLVSLRLGIIISDLSRHSVGKIKS